MSLIEDAEDFDGVLADALIEYAEDFDGVLADALMEGTNIDPIRAMFSLDIIYPLELRTKASFVGMELNFEAEESAAIFAAFHFLQEAKATSVFKRLFSAQVRKELKNLQIIHRYSSVALEKITLDRQKLYVDKLIDVILS